MTLDQALDQSTRFLTELWLQSEAEFLVHLADAGATDDELRAAREQSRRAFTTELRLARQHVIAVWYTGEAGIH